MCLGISDSGIVFMSVTSSQLHFCYQFFDLQKCYHMTLHLGVI